jgi:hypothetical protein
MNTIRMKSPNEFQVLKVNPINMRQIIKIYPKAYISSLRQNSKDNLCLLVALQIRRVFFINSSWL